MNWKIFLLAVLAFWALGCTSAPPAKTAKEYPSGRVQTVKHVPAKLVSVSESAPSVEPKERGPETFFVYDTPIGQVRYLVTDVLDKKRNIRKRVVGAILCPYNDDPTDVCPLHKVELSKYSFHTFHEAVWNELRRRSWKIDYSTYWPVGIRGNLNLEPNRLAYIKRHEVREWSELPSDVRAVINGTKSIR